MNIYVASSWKNARHPSVVAALKSKGHTVYDYRNPAHGQWSPDRKWWETATYTPVKFPVVVGDVSERQLAFETDMDALRAADAVVLVLDSGKSSHIEAGYAAGAGKHLVILGEPEHAAELMYGVADLVTIDEHEVVTYLAQAHEHPRVTIPAALTDAVNLLARACWQGSESKGWHADIPTRDIGHTLMEKLALIHSEVSEAVEAFRNPEWEVSKCYRDGHSQNFATSPRWSEYDDSDATCRKPEGVGSELADVVIRVCDLAVIFGIDLGAEIARKMRYNATRSHRHGGKRA